MRRITLAEFGEDTEREAARVLDQSGATLATIAEPASPPDTETLRDAIIAKVFDEDFGDTVLAGVAFAAHLGGDAVGFT